MKRHTKFFVVLVLIVGLSPVLFTLAQEVPTVDELMVIIADLKQQITQLQEEVDSLKSESKSTKIEIKFLRTLRRGVTGEEVEELQEFLKQFPDIYPEGLVTGYFGPLTEKAVQKFQMKNEIVSSGNPSTTGFGQVGPQTRKKLNDLITNGAGASGKTPPGLLTAPGLQNKFSTTTATSTESKTTGPPLSTPSGTVPAIPSTGSGGGAAPATPAVPATPAEPDPEPEPDTTPPVISNIQSTNITETSAVISWITDEGADSNVDIFSTSTIPSVIDGTMVTSHSAVISGLFSETTYTYTISSSDIDGNTATSSGNSFTTIAPPPPPPDDFLGPWITALSITPTSGSPGVIITYTVTAEDQNGIGTIVNEIKYPGTSYTLRPNWNFGGATSGTQTFSEAVDFAISPTLLGEYVIENIVAVDLLGNISRYYPDGTVENSIQSTHSLTIPSILIE